MCFWEICLLGVSIYLAILLNDIVNHSYVLTYIN